MKIVFIDSTCPKPYDSAVLAASGLGGTEATVVRVVVGLSAVHDVTVCQHNRLEASVESPTLRFVPMRDMHDGAADAAHVVFVTKAQGLARVARLVRGRLWIWLHNYLADEVPFYWQDHLRHRLGLICVSRTHADHTRDHLHRHRWNRLTLGRIVRAGVVHHYNPIDATLQPDVKIARDRDKLVFFSSPHKGIEQVLARFGEVHAARPQLRLFVADPGYSKARSNEALLKPGVVNLGTLAHGEVLRHVREASCVFYPQHKRAETFGLVFAESNAVGTAVLAHDFGAAREVLHRHNPPIDTRDPAAIRERLFAWLDGESPVVGPDARFASASVIEGWLEFLADPDRYADMQRQPKNG